VKDSRHNNLFSRNFIIDYKWKARHNGFMNMSEFNWENNGLSLIK
jgi:hypothetical protein